MFSCEEITKKLKEAMSESQVTVTNPRKDNEHFVVEVVWEGFKEMKLLEQHRKVYKVLEDEFKEGIHSVSLKTKST